MTTTEETLIEAPKPEDKPSLRDAIRKVYAVKSKMNKMRAELNDLYAELTAARKEAQRVWWHHECPEGTCEMYCGFATVIVTLINTGEAELDLKFVEPISIS